MIAKYQALVGAAGFEPTITGSKPDALPLGYAPKAQCLYCCLTYCQAKQGPLIIVKAKRMQWVFRSICTINPSPPRLQIYYRLSRIIFAFA